MKHPTKNITVKNKNPDGYQRGIDVDYTNGSGSSESDEDDNEDPRGKNIHNSALNSSISSRQYSFHLHGLPSLSSRAKSIQPSSLRRTEESKVREASVLLKSPAAANSRFYTSKADEYLINDSLTERRHILLDIPNRRNELVMAAYSTQSIPKLYPIVGLRKKMPGIALPPPIL